jgi:putative transposase
MPDGLKRLHHSGQAHFLTFSCYRRKSLLAEMDMQDAFLETLELTRRRFNFRVYGYVVMPEHVHLLVSEPEASLLAKAMQMLKKNVSIEARKKGMDQGGKRHFWLERYFDHNVRNEDGFITQLKYIHRNPVKRGLCAAKVDWKWSSFRDWALGEMGVVEVESEIFAARREAKRLDTPRHRNLNPATNRRAPSLRRFLPHGRESRNLNRRFQEPAHKLLRSPARFAKNAKRTGYGRSTPSQLSCLRSTLRAPSLRLFSVAWAGKHRPKWAICEPALKLSRSPARLAKNAKRTGHGRSTPSQLSGFRSTLRAPSLRRFLPHGRESTDPNGRSANPLSSF